MNNVEKTLLGLWLLFSGAIALFLILSYTQSLFIPLFIALLLTPVFSPAVNFLARKKIPEIPGISLLITFSLVFLGTVIYLFVFFSSDLDEFVLLLGKKAETFRQALLKFGKRKLSPAFLTTLEKILANNMEIMFQELMSIASETLGKTTSFLAHFLMTALYLFFLLTFRRKIVAGILSINLLKDLFPSYDAFEEIVLLTRKFIRGTFFVMLIMFVLLGIILWILQVPYPFIWSAIAAVANLIPYLGMTATGIACATVSSTYHESALYFLLILLVFWAVNIFENNVITPFFVGKETLLNPFAILLGALIGYYFMGIIGSILIIPYLVILKHITGNSRQFRFIYYLLGD